MSSKETQIDKKNFRVIFILKEISLDKESLASMSIRINVSDATKDQSVKLLEGIIIDISNIAPGSKIDISLLNSDGQLYGNGELKIPDSIFTNKEVEIEETISIKGQNTSIEVLTKVLVVFMNKMIFKERNKYKNTKSKVNSGLKTVHAKMPSAITTFNTKIEKSSPNRANSITIKANTNVAIASKAKIEEDLLNAYIDNVVEKLGLEMQNRQEVSLFQNDTVNIIPTDIPPTEPFDLNLLPTTTTTTTISPNSNHLKKSYQKLKSDIISTTIPDNPNNNNNNNNTNISSLSPKQRRIETSPDTYWKKDIIDDNGINSSSKRKIVDILAIENELIRKRNENVCICYLKNIILSLNAKLKDYQFQRNENERLKLELRKSDECRMELQQSILETTHEIREEGDNNQRQMTIIMNEKSACNEQNKDMMKKMDALNEKVIRLESIKTKLENEIIELHVKVNVNSNMKALIDRANEENMILQRKYIEEQNQYQKKIKEIENILEESKNVILNIGKEKLKLIDEIHELTNLLNTEKKLRMEVQYENICLTKKIENLEGLNILISNLQSERDSLLQKIDLINLNSQLHTSQIQSIRDELSTRLREFELKDKAYIEQILILNKTIQQLQEKNLMQDSIINEQYRAISESKRTISSIEQLLCLKEDVKKQYESANAKLQDVYAERNVLTDQIDKLIKSQNIAINKSFDLEKVIVSLRDELTIKDEMILHFKKMILDMKDKSPFYVPSVDDKIDIALAEYINHTKDPSQLKDLFIRESVGVYQFGSKKIYVKIEADKIFSNMLFMIYNKDANVQVEIEKMAKNDPIKQLQNTIAVQKTLNGRLVSKPNNRQNSPSKTKSIPGSLHRFSSIDSAT